MTAMDREWTEQTTHWWSVELLTVDIVLLRGLISKKADPSVSLREYVLAGMYAYIVLRTFVMFLCIL